jgi:hypothetical protein
MFPINGWRDRAPSDVMSEMLQEDEDEDVSLHALF